MNLTKEKKKKIRDFCGGQTVSIYAGRSFNFAGPSGAPIEILEGSDIEPRLVGQPYLKTTFTAHGGRFQKTLFTPSTRKIQVGEIWINLNLKGDEN